MTTPIGDIWFRCGLGLEEIAKRIGLSDVSYQAENYWEWVIGELDITRTHKVPELEADTRIFPCQGGEYDPALEETVIELVRPLAVGSIKCGQWQYRSGNDYDLVVVEEIT